MFGIGQAVEEMRNSKRVARSGLEWQEHAP